MNKIKLGTLVLCKSYMRKSGNMFDYLKASETDDGIPVCKLWNKDTRKYTDVDDYMETDRFKKIENWFEGIYVGTTSLCTTIFCSSEYDLWKGGDYFRFGKTNPQQFAIVYYADNKKRLVPIDDLEIINEEGAKNE